MSRKILLVALIAIFIGYVGWTFSESVTPYVSIAEAEASKNNVQVKGLLDKNFQPQQIDENFNFVLRDEETNQTMAVKYHGTKPDQFDSAYHVVAIGKYNSDDKTFHANKLLIKCPSKYENEMRND
ncbi:MAG: cytochrome c maturation protein CcmE [Selenomonadaceae bacterium]|nr:cytochrome c maturation protein CcmE [Selenomonadaceae bacterium]